MRRLLSYWAPLAVYMSLVFALSANPMPERMPDYWQIDKLYHFGAYLVMGLLWARAFNHGRAGRPGMWVFLTAAGITVIFGGLVEVYQSFLPYRTGDIVDAVANGAGGFAGVFLYGWLKLLMERRVSGGAL